METEMGMLLRSGVVAACLIMLVGGVLYILRHGEEQPAYRTFSGAPLGLNSIGGVLREVREGSARGIIQLSVLVMIATPVMRVVFAAYGFTRQRQFIFTIISLVVLGLLTFGLSHQA
jgi:uncharacterized membrane protein